jgi:hypothetical protein
MTIALMAIIVIVIVMVIIVVVVLPRECRERRKARCGAEYQSDELFHRCGFLQWHCPARTLAPSMPAECYTAAIARVSHSEAESTKKLASESRAPL